MKILNLYAGIGGNRKLWGNEHEVTAVEIDPEIAKIYKDFFPNDKVVVADAHQYLLDNYNKFDFIWSYPPCPSHSRVRKAAHQQNKPIYPEMSLYQEILFLQGYFKGKWVVENVISWYDPLIKPYQVGKHYYWANFPITNIHDPKGRGMGRNENLQDLYKLKGFKLDKYQMIDKMKTIRNCVEPEEALHIFEIAFKENQSILLEISQQKRQNEEQATQGDKQ